MYYNHIYWKLIMLSIILLKNYTCVRRNTARSILPNTCAIFNYDNASRTVKFPILIQTPINYCDPHLKKNNGTLIVILIFFSFR